MLFNKQTVKKIGLLFLKIFVSAISIYFVMKKIEVQQIAKTLSDISWPLLLFAFVFMNLSQFASTIRLKFLLKVIDIEIGFWQNLKLYYKGMFYNLFLPGGIGGDGIKAYLLKSRYGQSLKKIASCLILDRLSGLSGLLFLGCLGYFVSAKLPSADWLLWICFMLLILAYPAFYLIISILFKSFRRAFLKLSLLGMAVNLVQTVSVILLFWAIGTNANITGHLTVFYFATSAMVFPFTIGGVGIRELVFALAPAYTSIDPETGLSFCLLFFVMNAISSFTGIFLRTDFTEQNGLKP